MANYVYNYVFCNDSSAAMLRADRTNQSCEMHWSYDFAEKVIAPDKKLLIFETRGMEYRDEMIRGYINKLHDICWYCVEENCVEEGKYWWNGENVEFSIRKMVDVIDNQVIEIRFHDKNLREIMIYFISLKEMVVEDVLNNTSRKYEFSNISSHCIEEFLEEFIDRYKNEYTINDSFTSLTTVYIDWKNRYICIDSYDEDEIISDEMKRGKEVFTIIQDKLTDVFKRENISENIYFEF